MGNLSARQTPPCGDGGCPVSNEAKVTIVGIISFAALMAASLLSPTSEGDSCANACGIRHVLVCEASGGKLTKVECSR